eukprot:9342426-Alexandrium_andersonii.AAC.1
MTENKAKALLRSFAEYCDLGSHSPNDPAGETVKAVKKAARLRCHPDKLQEKRFPDWTKKEHEALMEMAKEVRDFACAYLDCSKCGSIEDD